MAEKFRFYRISEANTEIDRLSGVVADLESQLKSASGNDSEIANQATALKSENDSLKAQLSKLTSDLESAKADAAKAKTEADTRTAEFDKKVLAAASKTALTIVASQGCPPVVQTPSQAPGNPAEEERARISKLTGLQKVIAMEKWEAAQRKGN